MFLFWFSIILQLLILCFLLNEILKIFIKILFVFKTKFYNFFFILQLVYGHNFLGSNHAINFFRIRNTISTITTK